jgi:hypothetical protein
MLHSMVFAGSIQTPERTAQTIISSAHEHIALAAFYASMAVV